MKKIKTYVQILVAGVYTLAALPALAYEFPAITPLPKDTPFENMLTGVLNWLFGIGGGLAVLFLIYGGILYITGGAKAEETAKKVIMNSIIGIAVMAVSFVVAQIVINMVGGAPY